MQDDLHQEAEARVNLARDVIAPRIREVTLRWFQSSDLRSERKPDGSVVTPVDREAEDRIRTVLAEEFPDDGILGEERGETLCKAGNRWRWVLDPIDGTGSYVRGLPHWVLLIGIEHAGEPVAGMIDAPIINETLWATRSGGAFWRLHNGETRPARVSSARDLEQAMIEIGPARYFQRGGHGEIHTRLCALARRTRGWSDGYAFALLATGRVEAAINFGFHRWDLCAPAIILNEAGGRLTDWAGQVDLNGATMVASNGALHESLLRMIQPHAPRAA